MGKLHVGVLYGGRSVEHDISLLSAKNILQYIDANKLTRKASGIYVRISIIQFIVASRYQ
jgi:D-alanine-D-alanine ligase